MEQFCDDSQEYLCGLLLLANYSSCCIGGNLLEIVKTRVAVHAVGSFSCSNFPVCCSYYFLNQQPNQSSQGRRNAELLNSLTAHFLFNLLVYMKSLRKVALSGISNCRLCCLCTALPMPRALGFKSVRALKKNYAKNTIGWPVCSGFSRSSKARCERAQRIKGSSTRRAKTKLVVG